MKFKPKIVIILNFSQNNKKILDIVIQEDNMIMEAQGLHIINFWLKKFDLHTNDVWNFNDNLYTTIKYQ